MGVLIDASVLIEHERGELDLETVIGDRVDEDFFVSVVTASELLHGVHRATTSKIRARRSAFVEAVLESLPLLPIDLLTARTHARLAAELAREGTPIGYHDAWLAAACVAQGLSLATANVRELERVPGLEVLSW